MAEEEGEVEVEVVVMMIAEGREDGVKDEEVGVVVEEVEGGREDWVVEEDGEAAGTITTVVEVEGVGVALEEGVAVAEGLITTVVVELTTPGDGCCQSCLESLSEEILTANPVARVSRYAAPSSCATRTAGVALLTI